MHHVLNQQLETNHKRFSLLLSKTVHQLLVHLFAMVSSAIDSLDHPAYLLIPFKVIAIDDVRKLAAIWSSFKDRMMRITDKHSAYQNFKPQLFVSAQER